MNYSSALILTCLSMLYSGITVAQDHKRNLEIDDLAGWKTITGEQISDNGKFIAYEINPLKGDGVLVLTDLTGSESDTLERGKSARFTADSRFLVFRIELPEDSLRKARHKKTDKDKMPLGSLGIYQLNNQKMTQFKKLESFKFAEEQSSWMAFTSRPDSVISLKDKSKLSDLILYQFESGDTIQVHNVQDFTCDKQGNSILYQTNSADSTNTVRLFRFDTTKGIPQLLYEKSGSLKNIALNEKGDSWAFLFSGDSTKIKKYELLMGNLKSKAAPIAHESSLGLPAHWSPSVNRPVLFAENNELIYFGTAPMSLDEPADSTNTDEKPGLDIWSWTDEVLMPAQWAQKEKELKKNYLAVYRLSDKKLIQLGDTLIRDITYDSKAPGEIFLGENPQPYLRESSWTGRGSSDYYTIELKTGNKRLIARNKTWGRISPDENYFLWFEPSDSSYYVQNIRNNKSTALKLNAGLDINFYNEERDIPMEVAPYGIAGWARNDRFVYIYDKYDVWKFDPKGKISPQNVTRNFGRDHKIKLRYTKTDPKETTLPADQWLLSAFDEKDKSTGFYSLDLKEGASPTEQTKGAYIFRFQRKAQHSDQLLWTKESCSDFPDLWISTSNFKNQRKISNANPQQKNFIWSKNELVSWTSFTGEKLEGILYFPENFNPDHIYPMIIYYYELNSHSLNSYSVPSPSRSIINRSFYPSNGYLIFIPDITYTTGYPGQSAYNSIVSGANALINTRKYIDPKHIALQGQSWGGYQTAYLVTQTDMFAAAMAGAPVSNMTSAYGGIRWESGMSRMFQYEHTQSRIGGTLWEKPLEYIENSPIFYVPKIKTPLLIMHNDHDGAVPWYQGIELFVAMRRLNKPAWLLSYNNEPHNLKAESWANRIDLTKRMLQFFDHYLKGTPEPEWMKSGIPATMKGKTLAY